MSITDETKTAASQVLTDIKTAIAALKTKAADAENRAVAAEKKSAEFALSVFSSEDSAWLDTLVQDLKTLAGELNS